MYNLRMPDQKQTYQHRMANGLHASYAVCLQGVFLVTKTAIG